jgi:hypothetical protein
VSWRLFVGGFKRRRKKSFATLTTGREQAQIQVRVQALPTRPRAEADQGGAEPGGPREEDEQDVESGWVTTKT